MRKTTLILAFLAVLACGRAQNFLTPESIRSTDILEILLMNGVRITNHYGHSPEWILSMGTYYVCAPSFSPEYALVIRENELVLNKATTVLQHSIYSKQRMQDPDFRKLDKEDQKDMREMARKLEDNPVKSYSLPISKETSDLLKTLFEHATMTATHLESRTLGNDGTMYYFNHDGKMGSVWTPFGGRMWSLVNLADSLCYAVESQDSEVLNRQMKVCENLIQSFKKEYPLSYFKPTGFSYSSNAEKGPWHCEIAGFPNDECMWLEVLSDSAVSGEICSNVLRQYTDSLASWSREIFLISDNPIYPSVVIDNHADTAICVAKQYERYTSREITIPKTYWRREVILSAAQLAPGRYCFAEGEWRESESPLLEEAVDTSQTADTDEHNDSDGAIVDWFCYPDYEGGVDSIKAYIQRNLYRPAGYEEWSGVVLVEIAIETDGTLTNPKVINSLDPVLDAEAVKAVMSLPNKWTWHPERCYGGVIQRCFYNIPVSFSRY